MAGEHIKAPDIADQIFESHFQAAFDPESYQRAKAIFDEIGVYSQRSLAIQLHVAAHADKLDEALGAWEKVISPDEGYLHLVSDAITRAVEIKLFVDVVYGSVITEPSQDPIELMDLSATADIPKIFDLMDRF